MGSPLTTAYAGHADITSENAGAILNQFLPQDPPEGVGLGLVFIPERVVRAQKGLKTTIAWLETELGGADATIPKPNLIAAMLERREAEGDDLELYLLFDPDNEDDVVLANAANDAGIPVRNLAAAGDFLVFEEETVPEDETPPWEAPEPAAEAMARDARAEGILAGEQAAADARSRMLAEQLATAESGGVGITITTHLSQGTIKELARAIVAEMASLGAAQVAAQASGPVAPVVPIDSARPAEPAGRTEQVPGSAAFYYNADKGTYRKARGIARDGETKVFLTDDEQAEARAAKLLV